jgi:hypothetical protein
MGDMIHELYVGDYRFPCWILPSRPGYGHFHSHSVSSLYVSVRVGNYASLDYCSSHDFMAYVVAAQDV